MREKSLCKLITGPFKVNEDTADSYNMLYFRVYIPDGFTKMLYSNNKCVLDWPAREKYDIFVETSTGGIKRKVDVNGNGKITIAGDTTDVLNHMLNLIILDSYLRK